ncbi:dockerin type I repeat-containing protein, partial [Candidatus Marinimicrobia bacterium]|nr:dockerin type I repeat-containing protein [Candidatus Neomarinimicrobiota bacterium]
LHYIDGAAGFYHITIKKENINNPGDVNTATGWNWSYLMDAGSTWNYDVDVDGFNESSNTLPQLSFAADDPNVVWAVINLADVGGYADIDTEMAATNCAQWDTYIASVADLSKWSFDLFVLKSIDGGMTWSDAVNVTETEGDFLDGVYNGPEEMYAHTPQYSTSDNVYFMYQMPNWAWNEIGDPTAADHMNYVYVGFAGADLDFSNDDESCLSSLSGDVTQDGVLNVLDIVSMVNYIFGLLEFDDCQFEAGDVTQDGGINVADIVSSINIILGN